MVTVFLIIIGLGALIVSLYPLLKGGIDLYEKDNPGEIALKELISKKEMAYQDLKDLEFDLKAGKIDDQDYEILSKTCKEKALFLLKEIDHLKKGKTKPLDPLEEEIAAIRKNMKKGES